MLLSFYVCSLAGQPEGTGLVIWVNWCSSDRFGAVDASVFVSVCTSTIYAVHCKRLPVRFVSTEYRPARP